jgi:hypothetical protein
MNKIQQFFSWFSKQKIVVKAAIGCSGIILLCCLCTVTISIISPSTPTPESQNTSVANVISTPTIPQAEKTADNATKLPTDSPAPTDTSAPTNTPAPTETETPTLPPATQTAVAIAVSKTSAAATRYTSQTVVAANTTATAAQRSSNITATASSVAATKTQQSANAQATKDAKAATATYLAEFTYINYRELRDYADQHIGEKVCVRGRVFNILPPDVLQMYFAGTYDALYVEFADSFTGIYENDAITVCGTVFGSYSFQNAMGATISQPAIYEAFLRE